MRHDRHMTPRHDPCPKRTPDPAAHALSPVQTHNRMQRGTCSSSVHLLGTWTKPNASATECSKQIHCRKNQLRNDKNKRVRPRQRHKGPAEKGPSSFISRGHCSRVGSGGGGGGGDLDVSSTPDVAEEVEEHLRGRGERVRGGVDTSSVLPFCARCTMRKPPLLPRSRAFSFARAHRIRAPSESPGKSAQNKPLRAPPVKGERERET